jgi:hypothetical protein
VSVRIGERRGRAGLVSLENDWRRLYAASPQRTSYLAYEAQLAYVDHLMAEPDRLRCLTLEAGDEVRGICLLEPKLDRILGVALRVWGMTTPPHLPLPDVLCPEDADRRVFLPMLIGHLRRHREGLPLVVFGSLPTRSDAWVGFGLRGGREVLLTPTGSSFVISCDRTYDELLAGLGSRSRAGVRRHRRRLEALGDVRFETVTEESALAAALETFLEVEASGWKGARGTRTAVAFRNGQPDFFRELILARQGDDRCEISGVYVEGKCIAATVGMRTGGEFAAFKTGYDEEYSRFSPGHLLLSHTLERCCADAGISRVNLVSDEEWQLSWRPEIVHLQKAYAALQPAWGRLLLELVRFRVGPGRRLARWARAGRAGVAARRAARESSR